MKKVLSEVLLKHFSETVEQLAADIFTLAGHPPALVSYREENPEARRIHDRFVFRTASTMVINNLSKIIGWLNTNGAIREEYHCWLVAPDESFIDYLIHDECADQSLRGLLGYTYRGIKALESTHYDPMFRLGEAFAREVYAASDCWLGLDIIYLTKQRLYDLLVGKIDCSAIPFITLKDDAILATTIPMSVGLTERKNTIRFLNSTLVYPIYKQDGVVMLPDHTDEYLLSSEDARGDIEVFYVQQPF
ncbi:MAG: hypothetical protein ACRDBQ_18095 [Shewanella sp.]